jgi:hypothetical protein
MNNLDKNKEDNEEDKRENPIRNYFTLEDNQEKQILENHSTIKTF